MGVEHMARKEELKYILAEIQRDIALNKQKHAEHSLAKDERGDFRLRKVYLDHDVEIEWSREVGEA